MNFLTGSSSCHCLVLMEMKNVDIIMINILYTMLFEKYEKV